jgi:hypothetical protein
MNVEQELLNKVRDLSPEQQQAVLDFAASLQPSPPSPGGRPSYIGIWDHLGVHVTGTAIAEARREMWRGKATVAGETHE